MMFKRNHFCLTLLLYVTFSSCINGELSQKQMFVKDISQQLNWTRGFGLRLTNVNQFIIRSFIDITLTDCIWECGTWPRCRGIEYRSPLHYCRLVSDYTTRQQGPGYITVTGFDTLPQSSRDQACQQAPTTEQLTCHTNECDYPPVTGYVLGNGFEYGSKLLHHYNDGLRQLTCGVDGQWQYGEVFAYPGVTCGDIRKYRNNEVTSGVYMNKFNIKIYCEFEDENSWLVFQRRQDGSQDFYRIWNDYKSGFGTLTNEFWLGLEPLYRIIHSPGGTFTIRIDLEDWAGNVKSVVYSLFSITDETDSYRLNIAGLQGGDSFDSLLVSNGMSFYTYDRDNEYDCATIYRGGWWYNACVDASINGVYYTPGEGHNAGSGIIWKSWKPHTYSLKSTTMKIQRN